MMEILKFYDMINQTVTTKTNEIHVEQQSQW